MAGSHNVKLWRARFKQRIVDEFGGKCLLCGYNKCNAALELHHIDPESKDPSFSKFRSNPAALEIVAKELTKCILVCANCHREIHNDNLDVSSISINYDSQKFIAKYKIVSKGKRTVEQYAKDRRTINWENEFDNLISLKDIDKKSFVDIAKFYGVSDKTIAKWYKKAKENSQMAELVNATDC